MKSSERADGVPLFIEELTKAVMEAGTTGEDGAVSAIPSMRAFHRHCMHR